MKKIILAIVVIVATATSFSCNNNESKENERSIFVQDSIKTDSIFRNKIASLEKSIDSLLPYSERKNFKQQLMQEKNQIISELVNERIAELNLNPADLNGTYGASLRSDAFQSVTYELNRDGFGPKYYDEKYLEWERMHSKNVVNQRFKEEELSKLKSDYSYFKNGNK